jgi:hypothetical protein
MNIYECTMKKDQKNKNKNKTSKAILNARKRTPKNYPVSSPRPTCGDGC